jgi:hypothetical protein
VIGQGKNGFIGMGVHEKNFGILRGHVNGNFPSFLTWSSMVSGWERKPPLPRVIISEYHCDTLRDDVVMERASIGRHEDVFVNYRYIFNFSELWSS